jgi:hypothetical protein
VLAVRWRQFAGLVCFAVAVWASWSTGDGDGAGKFVTAVRVAVPMLIVLALARTWRLGVPVAAAVAAVLVGLVLLSTRRPNSLRPPQNDWLLPYLALAFVACVAVFVVRLRGAAPDQRKTMLLSAAGVLVVLVCLGALIGGRGGATPGSSHGDLDVDRHDLLPFPAPLASTQLDLDCHTGTGVCTEVLEISSSADGSNPTTIAEQLTQHLRAKGWPMKDGHGCLPIRGVFQWAEQVCASTVTVADFTRAGGGALHNGSVVLDIAAKPFGPSSR